jgi:DNA-binding beta-propeller fold protein YncE
VAGSIYDYGDGTGSHALSRRPSGLAIDPSGVFYVADYGNSAVRLIDPTGETSTVFEISCLGWPAAGGRRRSPPWRY